MTSFRVLLLLLVAAVLTGCTQRPLTQGQSGEVPTAPIVETTAPKPLAANEEIARRLALRVTLVEGDYTLDAFARVLEEQTTATIQIDWEALGSIDLWPKDTIRVKAGSTVAERALSFFLWHLAPKTRSVYPTFMFVDGTVWIGTNESLVKKLPQVNWPHRGKPGSWEGHGDSVRMDLQNEISIEQTLPLDQLLIFVRDSAGLKLQPKWGPLELVGIDRDSEVTFDLRDTPAERILLSAFEQVSEDFAEEDAVGFALHNGVVIVSTNADLASYTVSRTYDINDLFIRPYSPMLSQVYKDDPFALELLKRYDLIWRIQWQGGAQREFTPTFPEESEGSDPEAMSRQEYAESLAELIRSSGSGYDYWRDYGGDLWSIQELNGNFIIRTTESKHHEIEDLLAKLRHSRRLMMLRFVRELGATRLLKQAEDARRAGDRAGAHALADRAYQADSGNDFAWALREATRDTTGDPAQTPADPANPGKARDASPQGAGSR